ncbi:MAG: hypothetical protein RL213_1461 [Bacteroidota bacterium]
MVADQYFNAGEYEKAAEVYDRLSDFDPFGVYQNHFKCLIALKRYDDAEKLARKTGKKLPDNLSYQADIGYTYELRGEKEKAEQLFVKNLKAMKPDQGQILVFANSYIMRQDWDHALKIYQEGRRMMKGIYGFYYETAELYFQKGDSQKMIDEYLDAVSDNPMNQQNVLNILQARIGYDPESGRSEILRTSLLRRIQREPSQVAYPEMLIWLFVQQKEFESAVIQAKALDKRLKEDGSRLMDLGAMATANQQYETAIGCYQYVIAKGTESPHYITARMDLLNVYNKKLTSGSGYAKEEILTLEKDYLAALGELGKSARTAGLLRGLAHLRAFYLDEPDTAISDLDEALALPGLSRQQQADCKLELGDILLFTGNVWDSDLLYAQVDKDFKNDPLGQEAKFRSARLDYFRGDFLWAQAQLDVLKSATSQLIANDALYLSLLISDNIGLDSTTDALMLYARADLLSYRNKYDEALVLLDSLLMLYPDHSLVDETWYRIAGIRETERRFTQADSLYGKVVAMGEESILADDALFRRAQLNETALKDPAKAMEYYQELLTRFPGSLFTVEARKRFRSLRGDLLN